MESHGFKNIIKVRIKINQSINKSYSQAYLFPTKELKDNEPQGDIMTIKCEEFVRLFYININALNLSKEGHSWIQLCLSLGEKGVNTIYLTETNVNSKKQHIFNSLTKTSKDTWPRDKLTTCTSNTNATWKGDYKSGGTSITLKGGLSSSVINKGQANSELGR